MMFLKNLKSISPQVRFIPKQSRGPPPAGRSLAPPSGLVQPVRGQLRLRGQLRRPRPRLKPPPQVDAEE